MQKKTEMYAVEKERAIPSKEDWGDFSGDFDVADAYDMFFGRSNQEMQKYFAKNIMMRAQDIRFMPKMPFMYYMHGFSDYLISKSYSNSDAPDIVNCYLGIIEDRAEKDQLALISIFDTVTKGMDFIAANIVQFGVHQEIYGDFMEKICLIKSLIDKAVTRNKK